MIEVIEATLSHNLAEPAIEFAKISMELNTLEALYGGVPHIASIVVDEKRGRIVILVQVRNLNQITVKLSKSGAIERIHGGRFAVMEDDSPEQP